MLTGKLIYIEGSLRPKGHFSQVTPVNKQDGKLNSRDAQGIINQSLGISCFDSKVFELLLVHYNETRAVFRENLHFIDQAMPKKAHSIRAERMVNALVNFFDIQAKFQ